MSRENSYATLDADGQVPAAQLDNTPGAHPDLAAHNTLGLATQAELDAHATATHAATQAAAEATAAAALSGHAGDTTAIHGITDTAALSLTSHDHDADYEAAGGIATHSADTTVVHGIADTAALSLSSHDHDADYEATGAVATHEADTSVHGIADTTVLATDAEVATVVSDHAAAANPHPTYLTQAEGDAAYEATGVVATHVGLADPHTGYRLESADHSHASTGLQAGTIAHTALTAVGIDDHHARDHAINGTTHTGTLDDGQIPAGIARDAEVAAAVTAHEGLADPHPGYLTPAEGNAAYQPGDSDLTAIAALATTAFGRGLLALADAAALGANHSHSGASTTYAPGSFTVATGNYAVMVKRLQLTTTQRVTLAGTARLRLT